MENLIEPDFYHRYGGTLGESDVVALGLDAYRNEVKECMLPKNWGVSPLLKIVEGAADFEIINSELCNARAFIIGDRECFGVNWGLIQVMRLFSYSMLHDPKVFEGIVPSRETRVDKTLGINLRSPYSVDLTDLSQFHPGVQSRFFIAEDMVWLAFSYITHHELGHIAACHIPYLNSIGDRSDTIAELGYVPSAPGEALRRRCLELDADRPGLIFSYKVSERFVERAQNPEVTADNHVELWAAAIYLALAVMDLLGNQGSGDLATHPSPDVRLTNALILASREQEAGGGLRAEKERVFDGVNEVRRWWIRRGLPIFFHNGKWEQAEAEVLTLRNEYNEIRDDLLALIMQRYLRISQQQGWT